MNCDNCGIAVPGAFTIYWPGTFTVYCSTQCKTERRALKGETTMPICTQCGGGMDEPLFEARWRGLQLVICSSECLESVVKSIGSALKEAKR